MTYDSLLILDNWVQSNAMSEVNTELMLPFGSSKSRFFTQLFDLYWMDS